jgi:hypothetical protein
VLGFIVVGCIPKIRNVEYFYFYSCPNVRGAMSDRLALVSYLLPTDTSSVLITLHKQRPKMLDDFD